MGIGFVRGRNSRCAIGTTRIGFCHHDLYCNSFSSTCTCVPVAPTSHVCRHDSFALYELIIMDSRHLRRRPENLGVLGSGGDQRFSLAVDIFGVKSGE